jgi:hypothetical protein
MPKDPKVNPKCSAESPYGATKFDRMRSRARLPRIDNRKPIIAGKLLNKRSGGWVCPMNSREFFAGKMASRMRGLAAQLRNKLKVPRRFAWAKRNRYSNDSEWIRPCDDLRARQRVALAALEYDIIAVHLWSSHPRLELF